MTIIGTVKLKILGISINTINELLPKDGMTKIVQNNLLFNIKIIICILCSTVADFYIRTVFTANRI